MLTQNEPTHQTAWCCGKLGVMDVRLYIHGGQGCTVVVPALGERVVR